MNDPIFAFAAINNIWRVVNNKRRPGVSCGASCVASCVASYVASCGASYVWQVVG